MIDVILMIFMLTIGYGVVCLILDLPLDLPDKVFIMTSVFIADLYVLVTLIGMIMEVI